MNICKKKKKTYMIYPFKITAFVCKLIFYGNFYNTNIHWLVQGKNDEWVIIEKKKVTLKNLNIKIESRVFIINRICRQNNNDGKYCFSVVYDIWFYFENNARTFEQLKFFLNNDRIQYSST